MQIAKDWKIKNSRNFPTKLSMSNVRIQNKQQGENTAMFLKIIWTLLTVRVRARTLLSETERLIKV